MSCDGQAHIFSSLKIYPGQEVRNISLASDHKLAVTTSKEGDLSLIDTINKNFLPIRENGLKWTTLEYFYGKELVTVTESGLLTFWDEETRSERYSVQLPQARNCKLVAFHPFAPLLAVGNGVGYVQVFLLRVTGDVAKVYNEAKLVFQQKPFKSAVNQVQIDR